MIHTSLIVDECPMVQRGMGEFLASLSGMNVIGKAKSAREAIRFAEGSKPGIIFIEPNFTDGNPRRSKIPEIGLCRKLKQLPHGPLVVFYTVHNYPADVAAATLAGADSFIHKSLQEEDFTKAVEEVLAYESVWHFGLDSKQTNSMMHESIKVASLTPREQEILPLVLGRYSNKEIAAELHIRPQSAQNHVTSALRRLGYKSRRELHKAWGV